VFDHILSYVPVYGRWDDIVEYVSDPKVVSVIREQLNLDLGSEDGVSLLAKWMPSINTSSKETVSLAHRWVKALGWTPVQYRKNLSTLRGKIKLVETLMSQNQWDTISYGQMRSSVTMALVTTSSWLRLCAGRRRSTPAPSTPTNWSPSP